MTEPTPQAAHSGTCPSDCSPPPVWRDTGAALDYFEEQLKADLMELHEFLAEATQLRDQMRAWLKDHPQNTQYASQKQKDGAV